jgi:hypothetical protein
MSSLDKQGMAARKLQAEFTAEGKGYRERQKETTAKQRVLLVPIVAALKNGEIVNGQKGIENWAQWWNPTAKYPERQLQRIVGEPTETTSCRVPTLKIDQVVKIEGFGELHFTIKLGTHANNRQPIFVVGAEEELKRREKQTERFFKFIGIHDFAKATRAYKEAIKEAHPDNGGDTNDAALVNAAWDDYKKRNGWTGSPMKEEKTAPTKVKTVDPEKDLMKRFRAAKRAAKFFNEMALELKDGWDGRYAAFFAAYTEPDGEHSFPWTPPEKEYRLPKTEEEFHTVNEAAFAEFQKVLEEGKALGILTLPEKKTAPTEAVVVTVKDGTVCETSE